MLIQKMKYRNEQENSMINNDTVKHDYRKDIVERKRNKAYWGQWDSWNILYKTLAYEYYYNPHVEGHWYVRQSVIVLYDDELLSYVGDNYTFDIMNGWWNCFKVLFELSSRTSDDTSRFIKEMMDDIADIDSEKKLIEAISEKYSLEKETVMTLLSFLEVVYTCGNIVPVPKGGNRHADVWDSWEYKLNSSFLKYNCEDCMDYIKYFHFDEYIHHDTFKLDKELTDKKDIEKSVCSYMNSRVELIENRGKALVNKNSKSNTKL